MYTPVPHSGIQYDQGIGQDVNQFAEESSSEKKAIDEHYSDSPSSVTYVQSDPTKPRLVANNPKVKTKKGKTEKGKVPDLHITASNGNESSFISTPPRNSNNKEKIQTVSKDKELELLLVSDKAESGALNERTKTTPVSHSATTFSSSSSNSPSTSSFENYTTSMLDVTPSSTTKLFKTNQSSATQEHADHGITERKHPQINPFITQPQKNKEDNQTQEIGEQEIGEQEIGEQEIGDQEIGEQEIGEQEIGEQEIGEQEIGEQEIGEQEIGEQEIGEQEIGEQEIGEQNEEDDFVNSDLLNKVTPPAETVDPNNSTGFNVITANNLNLTPEKLVTSLPGENKSLTQKPSKQNLNRTNEPPNNRNQSVSTERQITLPLTEPLPTSTKPPDEALTKHSSDLAAAPDQADKDDDSDPTLTDDEDEAGVCPGCVRIETEQGYQEICNVTQCWVPRMERHVALLITFFPVGMSALISLYGLYLLLPGLNKEFRKGFPTLSGSKFVFRCLCRVLLFAWKVSVLFLNVYFLTIFSTLFDVFDVYMDFLMGYRLEMGEVINKHIYRNEWVINFIFAFAFLGVIKVMISLHILRNKSDRVTLFDAKNLCYCVSFLLEDCGEMFLEYFYIENYLSQNSGTPWFLLTRNTIYSVLSVRLLFWHLVEMMKKCYSKESDSFG